MPGENATPATQSEGLADAIHELLSQPESFLDRTGDPEQPHSVREPPDGTTVYTLPGAQSRSSNASSSVPEFNNADFNLMFADFIQATNTAISQLQDRVEALEEELKSLKQDRS